MTLHSNVSWTSFFIIICHQGRHPKGHFSVVSSLQRYCTGHFIIVCPPETVFRSSSLNVVQWENPLDNFINPKLPLVTIYHILDIHPRGHFAKYCSLKWKRVASDRFDLWVDGCFHTMGAKSRAQLHRENIATWKFAHTLRESGEYRKRWV